LGQAAIHVDAKNLEVQGGPVSLIDDVMQSLNMPNTGLENGVGQFSIADSGTLVYLGGGIWPSTKSQFVILDRQGHENILPLASTGLLSLRFSPDGQRVAYVVRTTTLESDVWIYDVEVDCADALLHLSYGISECAPESLGCVVEVVDAADGRPLDLERNNRWDRLAEVAFIEFSKSR
jgi:hypothetical protein